jgi:hypothetical protein
MNDKALFAHGHWPKIDSCTSQKTHKQIPKFKRWMLLKQNVGRGKVYGNFFTYFAFMS